MEAPPTRRRRSRPVRPRLLAGAAGGTVGAQITVVALWAVGAIFPGAEVPVEVAAALSGLATAGLGFATAYYHRDAE